MLRDKADRRTLVFVATYFMLFGLIWAYGFESWSIGLPLFVALCCFSWFCAVITHNSIHCAVFTKRAHNRIFQVVLTLTYGHPVSSYVSGHNLSHHQYMQTDRDLMRTSKVRSKSNLIAFLSFFPTISRTLMKGDFAFANLMRTQRPRWFRQWSIEMGLFLVVSLVLLVVDWKKALLFWYVPHLWAAWGIVSINYFQHDGCDEESAYNHSRNFVGRVFGWWTFNNGFHTIHHMHPKLHWSKLREAHAREVAPSIHPNLDQPSILGYGFRALVWPGRRLRYDGTPLVLPPVVPDQSWFPRSPKDGPEVSFGAEETEDDARLDELATAP